MPLGEVLRSVLFYASRDAKGAIGRELGVGSGVMVTCGGEVVMETRENLCDCRLGLHS